MISPRQARAAKTLRISDDLLYNALAMTLQAIMRFEVAPGYVEMYAPCGSGRHDFHIITVSGGYAFCDCEARVICKHILASVGRPALHAIFQIRAAQDLKWLEEVVDKYSPEVRELPDVLRRMVRAEWNHRDEAIRRSGGLVNQQSDAMAA